MVSLSLGHKGCPKMAIEMPRWKLDPFEKNAIEAMALKQDQLVLNKAVVPECKKFLGALPVTKGLFSYHEHKSCIQISSVPNSCSTLFGATSYLFYDRLFTRKHESDRSFLKFRIMGICILIAPI